MGSMKKSKSSKSITALQKEDEDIALKLAELGDRTSPDGKEHVSRANSTKSVNEKVNGTMEDDKESDEVPEGYQPWTGWGNDSFELPKRNIYATEENNEKEEEEEGGIWPPGSPD